MCVPPLCTVAGPDALEQIEQVLSALWAKHPHVPEDIQMRLGIAVSEIAANIIEHATASLDRLVQLQMWAHVHDSEVLVKFADDGIPAPGALPSAPPSHAMPDELAERGRGLPLAQSVLNRLTYHRADETNHWTLAIEHR